MKAAVLHGNEDIRYEDWPEPRVAPGMVKVRVRATGICGSDVPRVLDHGAHFYPIVLGHEFAGDVVEAGEGVPMQLNVESRAISRPWRSISFATVAMAACSFDSSFVSDSVRS